MKVGVIGTGYWGKKHVDEYNQLGHETIISDLVPQNLEYCKLNFGANPVSDYKEILNDDQIRLVSICTPNSTHFKYAKEALNAGKNVLLEKPISTNTKEASELIFLAEKQDLTLLVGHVFRFNNAILKLKELIRNKKLGRIFTVDISWTNLEPIFSDRDILFDLGVHPIDILDNIFEQKPTGVYSCGEGFRQPNPEYAIINCHFEDSFGGKDVFVNIELSWLNPIRNRKIVVVGSEMTAVVDCVAQKIKLINNSSGVPEEISISPNNTIRDELQFFIDRSLKTKKESEIKPNGEVKSNAIIEPNGEVGKRVVEIIELARISLNNGKVN